MHMILLIFLPLEYRLVQQVQLQNALQLALLPFDCQVFKIALLIILLNLLMLSGGHLIVGEFLEDLLPGVC